MGKVIERGKRRRAKQRKKEKPRAQYYGGDAKQAKALQKRNQVQYESAYGKEEQGLEALYGERQDFKARTDSLRDSNQAERDSFAGKSAGLEADALKNEQEQQGLGRQYGASADASLNDYRSGRSAILGNASTLEQNANNAAANYKSVADAKWNAARNQRQQDALSIAAGRGANSVRTALATADAGNAQANLDREAIVANEQNQLLGLQNDAVAQAAQIRAGLGAQDQSAAGLEAGRQQNAYGVAGQYQDRRANAAGNNANFQLGALGEQRALEQANLEAGNTAAGANVAAGQTMRAGALAAEANQEGAQLGANAQTEAQRIAHQKEQSGLAKTKKWTNALTLGILG